MLRRNFYILVASILTGMTITFLSIYAIIELEVDLFQDPKTVVIKGSGLKNEITLSIEELKSDKYYQVENQQFFIRNSVGSEYYVTYSGVSLWSILSIENLLDFESSFLNFIFIGRDAYRSPLPLNLSIAENNPYSVIIAYSKDGQPLIGDGPLRSVINQTVMPPGEYSPQYSVQKLARVEINLI